MAEKDTSKSEHALREERILAWWEEHKIFEQSLAKPAPKGEYVFYDGPPFATGLPHYGHILASTIKDAMPRYQTMRGWHVARRWGWDCHGLPIENLVEKELKISGKKEIEKIGVDVFNEKARSKVLGYVNEWKKTVARMGRWVDFDGSYKTMDNTYMESVWWALKQIQEKGLLYEGTRVLPYCPRCETPIANAEIAMDNSYRDISDISVYVKFELVDEPGTYLLAWTTTPWTLPGNVALAINRDISYVKIDFDLLGLKNSSFDGVTPGKYILAEEIFWSGLNASTPLSEKIRIMFGHPDSLIGDLVKFASNRDGFFEKYKDKVVRITGNSLVGLKYKAIFPYYAADQKLKNREQGWQVYAADFVTTEEGTGIVHIAPAFGEDDMKLGQEKTLPIVVHVDQTGRFKSEVTDFAGQLVKPKDNHQIADIEVIKYLAKAGNLLHKQKIVHAYPHCFRCETPLYYYAIPAWFIKIQELKTELLKQNQAITWIPAHLREGRFAKSMEAAPDWNISRNRYWATPLPFWRCQQCQKLEVIGSLEELKKQAKKSDNQYWVMRHGEAEHNVAKIYTSERDGKFHLTDRGRRQIEEALPHLQSLKLDKIYTSPVLRCRETAEIIAKALNLSVVEDERLRELEFGSLSGKPMTEFDKWHASVDYFTTATPGGESLREAKKRFGDFWSEIDRASNRSNYLIISHSICHEAFYQISEGADNRRSEEISRQLDVDLAQVMEIPFVPLPHNADYELDLHRPYIDELELACTCGGQMKRVPEVVDCWLESASMPFAAEHYPFVNKEETEKHLPADFVAEYIAQTRTWFYYMHVIAVALFQRIPFKHVVTTGTVLAEDGQKMSKSKGNFPDPWIIFDRYGVDALRLYLLGSPVMKAEDLNFSEKEVGEVYRKVINRLDNVLSFYLLYHSEGTAVVNLSPSSHPLDQWIQARLNQVIDEVTATMENYELDRALRPVEQFIDDLSTWYIRRSRERFKSSDQSDKAAALGTTKGVLIELAKLLAPFAPFFAEYLYQAVTQKEDSVHLTDWPHFAEANKEILEKMSQTRELVSRGLELRAKANIKVRQPLANFTVDSNLPAEYLDLIKEEMNVETVIVGKMLELDTKITPELQEQGDLRDLIRELQEQRKQKGLKPGELAVLQVLAAKKDLVTKHEAELKAAVAASRFDFVNEP